MRIERLRLRPPLQWKRITLPAKSLVVVPVKFTRAAQSRQGLCSGTALGASVVALSISMRDLGVSCLSPGQKKIDKASGNSEGISFGDPNHGHGNDSTGGKHCGQPAGARRQIHFAPLRDACSDRRRAIQLRQFFNRRRLRQYAVMFTRAGMSNQSRRDG